MKNAFPDLSVHIGPGQHDRLLTKILADELGVIHYTHYWPQYGYYRYGRQQEPELLEKSSFYNFYTKLIDIAGHHTRLLGTGSRYQDFIFDFYDRFSASKHKKSDLLIAWPQVSLKTIEKVKQQGGRVILEHPMVHVNTWTRLMAIETKRQGAGEHVYSTFSAPMVNRMLKEYEKADQINLLSSFSKNSFIEEGIPESKLSVTLPGIDSVFFQPPSFERNNNGPLKLLFAGRVELLKGIAPLLEALHQFSAEEVQLTLAGRVLPEANVLLEKAGSRVKTLGPLGKEQLRAAYQEHDMLFLPSIQESFGMVMLEAMSCGTAVAASKNTGAPDVIAHEADGLLYEAGSAVAIAESIQYILKHKDWVIQAGIKAREKITNQFTLQHYRANVLKAYGLTGYKND